jgi:hypothetical protein
LYRKNDEELEYDVIDRDMTQIGYNKNLIFKHIFDQIQIYYDNSNFKIVIGDKAVTRDTKVSDFKKLYFRYNFCYSG